MGGYVLQTGMATSNRDWTAWEVAGRGLDILFYVAIVAFLIALVFEDIRNNFLLVLIPVVLAFVIGFVDVTLLD